MNRAATLVLVMLAMSASAAVDARALAHEGPKTQWAPTRNFSRLNARVVFGGESRGATSPYAGEEWETAAGEKDWQYAAGNPTRFTDPSGRAIPPTLYSPLSPADPTPVAACKAGNVSACLTAGMTDAEIEAFFAERGVVTRLASREVIQEVTTLRLLRYR